MLTDIDMPSPTIETEESIWVTVSRRPSGFESASVTTVSEPMPPWVVILSELLVPVVDHAINSAPFEPDILISVVNTPPELVPFSDMDTSSAARSRGSRSSAATEASQSVSSRAAPAAVKSTPAASWRKGSCRSSPRICSPAATRAPESTVSSLTPPRVSSLSSCLSETFAVDTHVPATASSELVAWTAAKTPAESWTSTSRVIVEPDSSKRKSHLKTLSPPSKTSPADESLVVSSLFAMSTSSIAPEAPSTVS
mmetsp:Transcript_19327/g.50822  ORF Transcript_19327/g.50822 Transcript_19327/m.50822 type:complete len:254 (-) Transcript_19327:853-1614(-)